MCILPLRTHRKIAPLFVAAAGVLVVAVVVVWPRSAHHIKRSYSFTICSLSICCAQTLLQTSKTRTPRHLPLVWSTYYGPTQKILLFSRENICSDFRFNSIRVVFCCRPRSPSYKYIYIYIIFYFIFFSVRLSTCRGDKVFCSDSFSDCGSFLAPCRMIFGARNAAIWRRFLKNVPLSNLRICFNFI